MDTECQWIASMWVWTKVLLNPQKLEVYGHGKNPELRCSPYQHGDHSSLILSLNPSLSQHSHFLFVTTENDLPCSWQCRCQGPPSPHSTTASSQSLSSYSVGIVWTPFCQEIEYIQNWYKNRGSKGLTNKKKKFRKWDVCHSTFLTILHNKMTRISLFFFL